MLFKDLLESGIGTKIQNDLGMVYTVISFNPHHREVLIFGEKSKGHAVINEFTLKNQFKYHVPTPDHEHCGRNLYRADYVLKDASLVSTSLIIADSFEQVESYVSKGSTKVISINLIEDDISMTIMPREQL